jgi:hypothetical protein
MRDFIKNLEEWENESAIRYLCSIDSIGEKKAAKIIEYLL